MQSREEYNAYMRDYMLKRYYKRRAEMIAFLGGKCEECNSIENLEIDHKDPAKKSMDLSKFWNLKWDLVEDELMKCQLLCESCHAFKSIHDHGNQEAKGDHGTLSSWRHCKCNLCREAYNKWAREYKREYRKK